MNEVAVRGAAVTIRPPRDAERRAFRMLLPDAFSPGRGDSHLLALTAAPPAVLGAAAWHPNLCYGRPAWQVNLRVVRPARRRGIGARLLEAIEQAARQAGIATLITWHNSAPEPEAEAFLCARGFVLEDSLTTYETDIERLLELLMPLRERLLARAKVPAGVRLLSLPEAPLDQVARLHAAYLGGSPRGVGLGLSEALRRPSALAASVVLLVNDAAQGLTLVELADSLARVEARVVAPVYQGGWANVLLMAAALDRGLAHGARRVQFVSARANADTHKLARRSAAITVKVATLHLLHLNPAPEPRGR
jgi:GNAT superfamily N-acetyltransferase